MRGSGKTIDLAHRVVNLINSGEKNIMIGSKGRTYEVAVIVRCKDCANGEVRTQSWDGVQYVECHAHEEEGYDHEDGHPLDWFCADGERKEGR